jgi:hypothetical protein
MTNARQSRLAKRPGYQSSYSASQARIAAAKLAKKLEMEKEAEEPVQAEVRLCVSSDTHISGSLQSGQGGKLVFGRQKYRKKRDRSVQSSDNQQEPSRLWLWAALAVLLASLLLYWLLVPV